jgi:hypothetical protein
MTRVLLVALIAAAVCVASAGVGAADDSGDGYESTYIQSTLLGVVSSASSYDRQAAYDYAKKYSYKVCSDGYFFEQGYPPSYLGAGTSVPSGGYDCAHFVSCCIGNEPTEQGGGLDVPSRTETYGEPGADKLANWLVNDIGAEKKTSVGGIEKGDVIAYDWGGDGYFDHTALHLGSGKIATHSVSHWDANWNLGAANTHFIHIIGGTSGGSGFGIGDYVRVTENLNVRTGPGTSYLEITDPDYPGYAPAGTIGKVLSGPSSANGYIWWKIDYGTGSYSGWSVEGGLEKRDDVTLTLYVRDGSSSGPVLSGDYRDSRNMAVHGFEEQLPD